MDRNSRILAVKFFRSAAGREPVRDFYKGLSKEDRVVIGTDLKEVQFGWPLGMPLVRKVGKELWELRSTLQDVIVRTLFTVSTCEVVLLHVFIKKSQKLPQTEMKVAEHRLLLLKSDSYEE